MPDRLGLLLLLAAPAALTLYFGFSSGGYFVGATGLAAVVLALVLTVRITLAERPFAGVSAAVLVVAGALALFAVWTLLSALWSGAPGRALLEFDRALLYLLAFVALGSVPVTARRLEWALRGLAAAAVLVCLAGLVSRLAPDVLPTVTDSPERLSYPVSYWNALGLLAAIGALLCLHLTSGARQPRLVRALGAAAIPCLLVTLYLTLSRGAIGVAVLGVAAYVALARPWGLIGGLLSTAPAAALALLEAYRADLLVSEASMSAGAIAQGHDLALVVALCALGAGVLRAALGPIDDRLERGGHRRAAGRRAPRRGVLIAAGVGGLVLAIGLLLAFDAPDRLERQYARFVEGNSVQASDPRDRLSSVGNNGRIDHWRVAIRAFEGAPLAGTGAGTFQNLWARGRASDFNVVDGHSLYIETLAELGIVGLGLLLLALGALLFALLARARGRDRSLYAVLVAAFLAWAVHAGVDWDWELPAVTIWVFALGGLAIAARGGAADSPGGRGPAPLTRIVAAIGCLILAVTPALAALSQAHLDDAVSAFRRGDCRTTAKEALASISALSVRPAPFELLAYCDIRAGLPGLAERTMRKAIVRDPASWEYHYGMAIVRASAGRDPRAEARLALRLNPLSPLTRDAVRAFTSTSDPREWRRRAAEARLPILL